MIDQGVAGAGVAAAKDNRNEVIDAFRGLAVIAVILFHYTYRWGPIDPDRLDIYHFKHNSAFWSYGYLGVELFFVVSGFVIFMTLERCSSWGDFALRRFARLYPTYVFAMVLTFLFTAAFSPAIFHSTLRDLFAGLTMASPYLGHAWIDGAYWSLLVELKFYFWISVLYFVFRGGFILAWLGFCLFTVSLPYMPHFPGESFLLGEYAPFFFAGMAYYLRFKNRSADWRSLALLLFAAISYVELWREKPPIVHGVVLGIVIAFELFLTGMLDRIRITRLHKIGLVSYSLYLIHQFIGVTMIGWLDRVWLLNGVPAVALTISAVTAGAFFMYHQIEEPSHRAVRKWVKGKFPQRATRYTSEAASGE